jgi:predicted nucleotidyltransferase
MCDKKQLDEIMEKMLASSEAIFGEALRSVILYGSYARGDYDDGSDIDVMVLANIDRTSLRQYADVLVDRAWEVSMEYDTLVSVSLNNADHFHEWRKDVPFYRNVWNEGKRISA